MNVPVLQLAAIPGPALRAELKAMIRGEKPWVLIVDTRRHHPLPLAHVSLLLRLRRRARNRGGDLVLVVDEDGRQRLTHVGLQHWLPLAGSVAAAQQLLVAMSVTRQGAIDDYHHRDDTAPGQHDAAQPANARTIRQQPVPAA